MFITKLVCNFLQNLFLKQIFFQENVFFHFFLDQVSLEEVDRLANLPNSVVISCYMKLNLEYLVEALWGHLNMVRIYTKKPGCPPDFSDPIILRNGANVKHVCHTIHRTLPDVFKYALVWVNTKKLFLYQKTQINSISIFHFVSFIFFFFSGDEHEI